MEAISSPIATAVDIILDGATVKGDEGEWLVDAITREKTLPHICYHPRLGPIQTCDTCMVEVNGKLTRACSTKVQAGLKVPTLAAARMLAAALRDYIVWLTVPTSAWWASFGRPCGT